ncbi:hypothetical protein K2173_006491 [Erythroxylum novogranatense]|uniref:DUF4283 domain-containing protein n=1 Tax=Erythroxylum novogranatense TaxID=1862640 RepID=A0AAV8SL05_9ROSI|nr:hypothetical protein K2173_006491 [Erythroxylum novogranatense]
MGTLQHSVGGRPSQPPSSSRSFKEVLGSHASFATPDLLFDSAPTDPDQQALVGRHKGAQLFHSRNNMFNVWRNLFNGLCLANFPMDIISRIRNWEDLRKLVYEKVPSYCQHCWLVGHSEDLCHVHNPELKIPVTDTGTDQNDVTAQHVLKGKRVQNHHTDPIQGSAKQNATVSGVSVIGTEYVPKQLAPPATMKTSSSEKGLGDLSRQDHFPTVDPPASTVKASMPKNAPAPEI